VIDDFDRCYTAIRSKDPRFDGWFITAVTSTGIYCRPSCPAMTPKRENVRFHPSAAAAQQAGFRACKRCRPDAAPGSPEWDGRADVVARAMRLIADGEVDRAGVPGLAAQLGYSVRQLQRLLLAEVGAGPIAIARAQRVVRPRRAPRQGRSRSGCRSAGHSPLARSSSSLRPGRCRGSRREAASATAAR
jgi:AraC family transcriptional regulator of adaptative response / DNA-3-methyladenine glycosylase II